MTFKTGRGSYHAIGIKTIMFFRFVVLIMEEMKIHEDLIFDKTGQILHGFVNLGDIKSDLKMLESQVSNDTNPSGMITTHMLTLMVRGIYTNLMSISPLKVTQNDVYLLLWQEQLVILYTG